MRPQIIRGPLAALEARLADDVRALRRQSPLAPLTILIGSTLLRPYLRHRLAELHGGLLNLRLMTMHDLASSLASAAVHANGTTRLPHGGDRLIAQETAGQAQGYFENVAQAPGFAEALERLFHELRGVGLDADSFAEAVARLDGADDSSTRKLAEISSLYRLAQQRREGFHGADDLIRLADPARFDSTTLLVYGMWGATSIQQRLLERLMERVTVTFYLPDGNAETSDDHADLHEWLARHGAVEERLAGNGEVTSALDRLQSGLFDPPSGNPAPFDHSVRLVSAPDTPREVREAARACLRWAEEGIGFHEMAVAYRQPEPYRALIDEVFGQAGIPVYLHDGRPLSEHPVGRRLRALLSLIGSRLTRASVMEFLTETRLPTSTLELYGGFQPAAWDEITRNARIIEGGGTWFEKLREYGYALRTRYTREAEEPSARLASRLAEIEQLQQFVGDLFPRLDDWPARANWEAYRARLGGLASDYIQGIEPVIERLERLDSLEELSQSISFSRFVLSVLAALHEIDSSELFEQPRGAFARQGVNVLDVNSLRHLRFRAVIVLGLTERAFPSPPRQDALLLDEERDRLNGVIDGSLALRARGPDPEPLQFTLAVAAARERLQLSCSRGDASGRRAMLPSYFFRAAAETLTGQSVTIAGIDSLPPEIFERVPANRFGAALPEASLTASEFDRTLIGTSAELGTACLLRRSSTFTRARQAWNARWRSDQLTAWDGMLDPERRLSVSRDSRSIAPTRLETYATCPYRYFLHAVLRLEEVEEPETTERLSALDRGSLIHHILEHFLSRFSAELAQGPSTKAHLLPELQAVAEEHFAEAERQGQGGFPLVWAFDKAAIFEDLEHWLELELEDQQVTKLHPQAFEVRFGPAWFGEKQTGNGFSIDEPVSVSFKGGELRFHGRIDRIDLDDDQTSFRVIDYKTGRAGKNGADQFTQGTTLQLPIYLLAASHALKKHGIDVDWRDGEAEYFFSTTRGGYKRIRFSGRALGNRWQDFEQLLSDLTGQITRGDFHPEPGKNGDNCRFCLGKPVCDQRILRLAERKAGAREQRFLRIQDVD